MSSLPKILIVEDDKPLREACLKLFTNAGYDALAVSSADEALAELKKTNACGIVLTDLKMPNIDGMELLKKIKEYNKTIDVIVMTGYGTVQGAVEAMKFGATDYITKPFNKDELLLVIQRIIKMSGLRDEIERLRSELHDKYGFHNIIGKSPGMKQVFEKIMLAGKNDSTVLLCGESGTGKELVARAIHYNGTRTSQPFIPIDCPALPKDLFESELFGHKKGAFTNATNDYQGLFRAADHGTVFLDEITEMPQATQAKLLRSLQERKIRPIGSTEEIPIDIRIIAATNRDITLALKQGVIREDLFYRLSVIQITIPPLRERKEDIVVLVEHFLQKQTLKSNTLRADKVSPDAMHILLSHNWPGNVRELENTIEHAVTVAKSDTVTPADLPEYLIGYMETKNTVVSFNLEGKDAIDFPTVVQQVEKELIYWALAKCAGNQVHAADLLKIPRSTLRDKISKIEPEH